MSLNFLDNKIKLYPVSLKINEFPKFYYIL